MRWQYRTIVFEYQKDGLLGDRYVDDEEVEQTLNEQGNEHWELVGITTTREGLLAFMKKPVSVACAADGMSGQTQEEPSDRRQKVAERDGRATSVPVQLLQEQERRHRNQSEEEQRRRAVESREEGFLGDIKIS